MVMRKMILFIFFVLIPYNAQAAAQNVSEETQSCVSCHDSVTPGIFQDWLKSAHSMTTPAKAMEKPGLERKVSAQKIDEKLKEISVGCYECHSRNLGEHKDVFEHFGYKINVVVSPKDCAICHSDEEAQFRASKKANAHGNLSRNPVFSVLVEAIIGIKNVKMDASDQIAISTQKPSEFTKQETCYSCHGTEVKVTGRKEVETKLGTIEIPELTNWPNQGVGRINPDGSKGACTTCHPRHSFSIEIARKPFTCAQCHLDPDVPAWNVYNESKHGNIFLSKQSGWNFEAVPWKLGKDFQAPTCSTCHNSLITTADGETIVERTHDFGARLWVRLFGLIYSHPQPQKGDTSIIKNRDGQPLPTAFSGEPASEFLIGLEEQNNRRGIMKGLCNGCHNRDWINGHFTKLDNTIKEADQMTLAATKLITRAWQNRIADPLNPFDEAVEQRWVKQWLFYANSVRFASAMTGAPDYAAFKNGWWELTNNLREMKDKVP
jgi:hypothetical protein